MKKQSLNYFATFPDELLLLIVDFLDVMKDFPRLAQTDKRLKSLVYTYPLLKGNTITNYQNCLTLFRTIGPEYLALGQSERRYQKLKQQTLTQLLIDENDNLSIKKILLTASPFVIGAVYGFSRMNHSEIKTLVTIGLNVLGGLGVCIKGVLSDTELTDAKLEVNESAQEIRKVESRHGLLPKKRF